jgi:hypothetical protein
MSFIYALQGQELRQGKVRTYVDISMICQLLILFPEKNMNTNGNSLLETGFGWLNHQNGKILNMIQQV